MNDPDGHCLRRQRGAAAIVALVLVALAALVAAWRPVRAESPQAADSLRPGEYVWMPELAPRGPLVVVVSLPAQRAYVYRNGIRIGVSTVSTGRPGYETPGGVYTILQKHREHYSNLYDNAPMPYMQRLSWDGVALHAGRLPGYPASHGCVRLPPAFAERLYAITAPGTVVVVAAAESYPSTVTSPGLFAPVDTTTGSPVVPPVPVGAAFEWTPERSPDGPLTVLLGTRDRHLVVMRNAVEIGHAVIDIRGEAPTGTQAYVLLEGSGPGSSPVVPGRPALRWMALPIPGAKGTDDDLRAMAASGRLVVAPEFARQLYDALRPGATVVVTDEPLHPGDVGVTVLSTNGGVSPEPDSPQP